VDDHPGTAATMARVLSQLGPSVEIISATSARSALERVRDGAVDLLITDMMMPDMNGLELIEHLNNHPGGRPSFTILITGYDVPGLRESARRLKVNEIIIKPFHPERLFQAAQKALESISDPGWSVQAGPARRQFKILVADDVNDNVALLSRYLESEGYCYSTASNGAEALQRTRSDMPDLVLLDVNMPVKDGFAVLQEIRADPVVAHIPVIMLTAARIDSADMRVGLNLGADDYVTKPFDRRELLARIRTKLRAKEAEETIRRRYNEFGVLPEIAREFSGRLEVTELTGIILKRLIETLGAMAACILIPDPAQPLDQGYCISASPEYKTGPHLPVLSALLERVNETRQCVIIDDARQDSLWHDRPDGPTGSIIALPLLGRLELIGLLVLNHEQAGYFVPEHRLLLQAIASQATIALEAARLHERLMRDVSEKEKQAP
jgi:CheY-like chemotaxis protein